MNPVKDVSKDQAPATQNEGIEVLELDRAPEWSDPSTRGGRGKQALTLVGLATVVVIGLILLPDPIPQALDLDAELPTPVVATTLPDREVVSVGVIGTDTFPLQFESSLEGFRSLAGPAFANGTWWMIGNGDFEIGYGDRPTILSSVDGAEWNAAGQFPVDDGRLVEVHDLIAGESALIAVGPEGASSIEGLQVAERIQVWRSADGSTWIPEEVSTGSTFLNATVRAQDHNLVVTATDAIGHDRLYHSSSFTRWDEIHITFSTAEGIVKSPDGGFLLSTSQGAVLTSAYGVNWSRNQAIDRGFYEQWKDEVVGTYIRSGQTSMRVIGRDDVEVTELPDAFAACSIHGGLMGLLAICPSPTGDAFQLFLSEDGLIWLQSQSMLLADDVQFEGDTDQGFLVSMTDRDGNLIIARATLPQ